LLLSEGLRFKQIHNDFYMDSLSLMFSELDPSPSSFDGYGALPSFLLPDDWTNSETWVVLCDFKLHSFALT